MGVAAKRIASVSVDLKKLRELVPLLRVVAKRNDFAAASALSAMSDILDKLESGEFEHLTERQRAFVSTIYKKYADHPEYKNLWSEGEVGSGRVVVVPECLRPENLPKKPPGRKI